MCCCEMEPPNGTSGCAILEYIVQDGVERPIVV